MGEVQASLRQGIADSHRKCLQSVRASYTVSFRVLPGGGSCHFFCTLHVSVNRKKTPPSMPRQPILST
jgi:hypothetical protein